MRPAGMPGAGLDVLRVFPASSIFRHLVADWAGNRITLAAIPKVASAFAFFWELVGSLMLVTPL